MKGQKIELPEHDCLYETTNDSGFIDQEPAYRKSTVLRMIEPYAKRIAELEADRQRKSLPDTSFDHWLDRHGYNTSTGADGDYADTDVAMLHEAYRLGSQRRGEDERHAAETLATAIYQAAQRVGIANADHSNLSVSQCLHLLDCMSQPAEPDPIARSVQNARKTVHYWHTKCRHMAELMVAEADTLSGIEAVVVDYLRPDGITRREAMTRIIELVDAPETESAEAHPNPSDTLHDLLDEAYAELLADSHRDGPRCLLLTRMEAVLEGNGRAN